jgi:hypothetical protein
MVPGYSANGIIQWSRGAIDVHGRTGTEGGDTVYERPKVTRLGLLSELTSKSGSGNDGNDMAVGMADDYDVYGKSDD